MPRAHDFAAGTMRPRAAGAGSLDRHDAGRFPPHVSRERWRALWTGLARMDGIVPPAGGTHPDPGPLSGGRDHPSGAGRSDGGTVRTPLGRGRAGGPRFDEPVPPGGYAWWYVDGMSDD